MTTVEYTVAFWRSALSLLQFSVLCLVSSALPLAALAQVSDTEVNEKAIDEFGLERKTGRISWSSGAIIGIGGEDSRISLSITGVRSPPRATRTWPETSRLVTFNEPRLLSEPLPDPESSVPYTILPDRFDHTVETPGGANSFWCYNDCVPQYIPNGSLVETDIGVTHENRAGVVFEFTPEKTVVSYPDGRRYTYHAERYWSNNFGFMLKFSSAGIHAVNQAEDYCDPASVNPCTNLSAQRKASISYPTNGTIAYTNPASQTTTLRWEQKTAKLNITPAGAPPDFYIPSVAARYLRGVKYPGSVEEDITVEYNTIDPLVDTHDQVRVSSIKRGAVTSNYIYSESFPQGVPEYKPTISEAIESLESTLALYIQLCQTTGAVTTCNQAAALQQLLDQLRIVAPAVEVDLGAGQELFADANLRELSVTQIIGGQTISESFAVMPGGWPAKRRRLENVTDALGRKTEYLHNKFEEVAGTSLPEGNGMANGFDARGNLISSTVLAKTVSTALPLTTSFVYPETCTGLSMAVCNSPTSMTDAMGNTTQYEYNAFGQITKETGPAPYANSARPTIVNEYEFRTAYIKDASGNPVAAGPPISLRTRSFSCISSSNCSASTPAADKIVTEYDYGPTSGLNNLLLRGVTVTAVNANGSIETLRTCYSYNYFGERISETEPRANLSSCQ